MTADSHLQDLFAERIGGKRFGTDTAIYKFEKIKRAKRAALAASPGVELFDLGVGEPDEMAFPGVVKTLCAEAHRPENRGYSDNGGDALKSAAGRYLQNVCGVTVDPETQIVHSIGSKPALAMLAAALIDPGDVALMTVPGYPVFRHACPLLRRRGPSVAAHARESVPAGPRLDPCGRAGPG